MKLDDAWIKTHGREMDEKTAKFLLSVLGMGKLKFPLSPEAVEILKRRAGALPIEIPPKAPPPPFIAPGPRVDQQSKAAGERAEEF